MIELISEKNICLFLHSRFFKVKETIIFTFVCIRAYVSSDIQTRAFEGCVLVGRVCLKESFKKKLKTYPIKNYAVAWIYCKHYKTHLAVYMHAGHFRSAAFFAWFVANLLTTTQNQLGKKIFEQSFASTLSMQRIWEERALILSARKISTSSFRLYRNRPRDDKDDASSVFFAGDVWTNTSTEEDFMTDNGKIFDCLASSGFPRTSFIHTLTKSLCCGRHSKLATKKHPQIMLVCVWNASFVHFDKRQEDKDKNCRNRMKDFLIHVCSIWELYRDGVK